MVIGLMGSGVLFGICSAMMIWQAGHHPVVIGLAYAVGGVIGVIAFVCLFAPADRSDVTPSH